VVSDAGQRRSARWLGVVLLAAGSYLVGDPGRRLAAAWDLLAAWWPWALLALAVFNLFRTIVRVESLLAPGVLGLAGLLGLVLTHRIGASIVFDIAIPIALVTGGALLALSGDSPGRHSWTRVLFGKSARAPAFVQEPLRARAILTDLSVDLGSIDWAAQQHEVIIYVTAVLGRVELVVPQNREIVLHAGRCLLTRISGPPVPGDQPPAANKPRVHVLALCAIVRVSRR
jgi:hypothetical protein